MCLRARPMSHQGYPQIFSGLHIHFNGVIPRTLKHPSHGPEWRMAERHGATCDSVFDPSHTNILVYRPGYERSDKVRLCVTRYQSIPCVPIAWLLDSLLQSRQIHPVLYRLQAVPAVALPTVRGPVLPHHQHPFFVLNAEEYALGPLPGRDAGLKRVPMAYQKQDANSALGIDVGVVPDAIWTTCSPIEAAEIAAISLTTAAEGDDDNDEDDVREDKKRRVEGSDTTSSSSAGIELFTAMLRKNRLNRTLFEGLAVILSETLLRTDTAKTVIEACGGAVVPRDLMESEANFVIYHNDDKKDSLMIDACKVATGSRKGQLTLATFTWLEDCLMLGELIPALEQYGPSAKLLATLAKKLEKRQAPA